MKLKILLFLITLTTSIAVFAQLPPRSDTTSTPLPNSGHDYIHAPVETVNPANGSLSIRIAVPMPPNRGLTVPFSFAYDTNGVNYVATGSDGSPIYWTTKATLTQGGWSYTVPAMSVMGIAYTVSAPNNPPDDNQTCELLTSYVFQDAGGNRHNMNIATSGIVGRGVGGNCSDSSTGGYDQIPTGGEGSIMAVTSSDWQRHINGVTVTDADGTTYSFPDKIGLPNTGSGPQDNVTWLASGVSDRNGNGVAINQTYPSISYTDSVGRTALNISSFGSNPDTITASGLGAPYYVYWTNLTPSFTANFVRNAYSYNCTAAGPSNNGQQYAYTATNAIILPNGQQYSFSYDPIYGVVNKITYPTGAYVRYVWGLNRLSSYGQWTANPSGSANQTQMCDFQYDTPAIQDRYVSFDGATESLHQHFDYATTWISCNCGWSNKTTTVTTTDQVRGTSYATRYTYLDVGYDAPPYQQDCPACQTPAEQTVQYFATADTNGSPTRTVSKSWLSERALSSEKTTLDNGYASETDYSYDRNAPWNTAWTSQDTELVSEKDDYDFGSGSHGPLLRATKTTYAWDDPAGANQNLANVHIIDRPSKVTIQDATGSSGNVWAGVSYGYDVTGNVTDRYDWLNSSGSSNLHTQHAYDAYGNMTSTTDPQGNVTGYGYTNNWADTCNFTPVPNAYLTSITLPGNDGNEQFSYHCASGELASSTDQNSQTTFYTYSDPLARLTEIDYPSGWGKSTITYTDSSTPSIETKRFDSSGTLWADSFDLFDGIFHQLSHSKANGQTSPWDRTDTCYDGEGRVFYSVYAYQTSSPNGVPNCSGGATHLPTMFLDGRLA